MTDRPLYCSFCGKADYEVATMVAGPTVFICNECVEVCIDVIDQHRPEAQYGELEYLSWFPDRTFRRENAA